MFGRLFHCFFLLFFGSGPYHGYLSSGDFRLLVQNSLFAKSLLPGLYVVGALISEATLFFLSMYARLLSLLFILFFFPGTGQDGQSPGTVKHTISAFLGFFSPVRVDVGLSSRFFSCLLENWNQVIIVTFPIVPPFLTISLLSYFSPPPQY